MSVGTPGNERQIVNVERGFRPTDAVNLQQLDEVKIESRRGIAGAAALGHYKTESAVGVNFAYWIRTKRASNNKTKKVVVSGGATLSGSGKESVYRIGVGMRFRPSS